MPQIEVTFDIDANGIVNVSAKDKATNKEQSITITGGGSLSDSDIEKMVDEAKSCEAEDAKKLELITARNRLDTMVYQSEKMLNEHREAVSADTVQFIEQTLQTSREALDSDDVETLNNAANGLEVALQKIGEELYKANAENTASTENVEASEEEPEIVDAEFEDV